MSGVPRFASNRPNSFGPMFLFVLLAVMLLYIASAAGPDMRLWIRIVLLVIDAACWFLAYVFSRMYEEEKLHDYH